MSWKPGPKLSQKVDLSAYDENDPWTVRFISEAENGALAFDEHVRLRMSYLRAKTEARAVLL